MALALCLTLLPAPAWAGETGAPKGGAAQIGNTVYSTLPEAVNAAQDGDTIKLLADYKTAEGAGGEGESDLTITKSVTLDLNGYKMDGFRVAQVNDAAETLPSGNLTVEDTSEEKTGKVTGVIRQQQRYGHDRRRHRQKRTVWSWLRNYRHRRQRPHRPLECNGRYMEHFGRRV